MDNPLKDLFERGVAEIIGKEGMIKKLESGKTIRVKYGIDPTSPHIHLGHAVPIRKLRAFQQMGHTIVFIVGDYTALIGDPTGKEKTRAALTRKEVERNAKTYFDQAYTILDKSKTEVHHQTEWFGKFTLVDVIELISKASMEQVLSHETFKMRLENHRPFFLHEAMYPLLQGYDSVELKADLELGGVDQTFNLLMGRHIQRAYEQPPQAVMTMKYLVGTDGKEKMGKSLDNTINLTDSPEEMYGKVMSVPDELITQYFELATDLTLPALAVVTKELKEGKRNPRDVKAELAKLIVELYHDPEAAENAEAEFATVFRKKELPSDIPEVVMAKGPLSAQEALVKLKLSDSKSEARRLIEQGGLQVDGKKVGSPDEMIEPKSGMVIQVGKRRFVRIR